MWGASTTVCASLFHLTSTTGTSEFQYYTGSASYKDFDVFWRFLNPIGIVRTSGQVSDDEQQIMSGAGPHSTLSEKDQLLIVLIRLCIGAAIQFGVLEWTVWWIFHKWINYLYLRLGGLPTWST